MVPMPTRSPLRASQYRALALMYLSQSLPTGLAFAALGALIRDAGHGVAAVGWTGLAFIPWALRFLWASAADNACARWGHGLVALALQALMVAFCLLLAAAAPADGLGTALAVVVVLTAVAATQGALGGIVVEWDARVVEKPSEARPPFQHVADGLAQFTAR